ncbi:hypothetical protein LCGC14_1143510 [marine sediment metagenome]|uniref:Uncharacterized protein n=1 Tax=marine sediment metagenome TaxID=412755 RepID=A0A0F9M2F5_9ZZZZ
MKTKYGNQVNIQIELVKVHLIIAMDYDGQVMFIESSLPEERFIVIKTREKAYRDVACQLDGKVINYWGFLARKCPAGVDLQELLHSLRSKSESIFPLSHEILDINIEEMKNED